MIELCALSGGYGGKPVVETVSTRFLSGALNVLIGPNGCGKSTLLRMASGLMTPQSGRVLLAGRDIQTLRPQELARQIAYLPQSRDSHAIAAKTLVLHGRFPHLGYPRRYRREDTEAAQAAMARLGIESLADQTVNTLSGGERQKVYFAMMLAQGSPVMLMDEPTTFLDIGRQLEVMDTAQWLRDQGQTLVVVLHDLNLALSRADRLFVMHQGQLLFEGTPADVYASGVLEEAFQVRAGRMETPEAGTQYYFTPKA